MTCYDNRGLKPLGRPPKLRSAAFTLIELLVAVSILVIVILSIGLVFRSTGRAVRTSNAVIDVNANARAVMRQIADDVARLDRSGFLAIRTNVAGDRNGEKTARSQLSFLAHGMFSNATGGKDTTPPGRAEVSAHAAHIWYGFGLQLDDLLQPSNAIGNRRVTNFGTRPEQDFPVQLTDRSLAGLPRETDYTGVLARHAFLLMPANSPGETREIIPPSGGSNRVPAHPDIARIGPAIPINANEANAHPSSGRTSVASLTPGQLMTRVRYQKYQPVQVQPYLLDRNDGAGVLNNYYYMRDSGLAAPFYYSPTYSSITASYAAFGGSTMVVPSYDGSDYWYEVRNYCYPFKVIGYPNLGANDTGYQYANERWIPRTVNYVNGAFRMSPFLLKYCRGFEVYWTDGQTDGRGNLRWFGNTPNVGSPDGGDPASSPLDVYRNTMGLPPQWPPVEFHAQRWTPQGRSDSALPPVTDIYGQYRKCAPFFWPPPVPGSWNYQYSQRTTCISHDNYNAIFSFDNRDRWPKALRIRMTVLMPGAETAQSEAIGNVARRTFTQVIWLPQ